LHEPFGEEIFVMAQFVCDLAGNSIMVASASYSVAENSKQAHGLLV